MGLLRHQDKKKRTYMSYQNHVLNITNKNDYIIVTGNLEARWLIEYR